MRADFERSVHERLAQRVHCAGDRGRTWSTKALVCELCEHSARIRARLSALDGEEETESTMDGLLRCYVGAMTRSDEGNGCCLLRR
jgi:hypothetical protein